MLLGLDGSGCYNPEPAANLACSPTGECPDGQLCAADNTCRIEGDEPPPVDAEPCPALATCEPETVSPGPTTGIALSAAHPSLLFWTSPTERQVLRTDKANLATQLLDQGEGGYSPFGLAADETYVYWSDSQSSGGIYSQLAVGGGVASLIVSGQDFPLYVAVDQDHIYWTSASGLVLRATKAGAELRMVAAAPGDGPAGSLFLAGDRLYFTDQGGGRVLGIAKDGSGDLETIASDQGGPLGIAADGEHVYWTNSESGRLLRRPIAGGEADRLADDQQGAAFVVAGDRYVFWTNRDDGRVMRLNKETLAIYAIVSEQSQPSAITLDGDALYWINQGGPDRLQRIYPCACR